MLLVGQPSTQDELLVAVIASRLNVQCGVHPLGEPLILPGCEQPPLLVLDASGASREALAAHLDELVVACPTAHIAVVNISPGIAPEPFAMRPRVVGIFPGVCPHETLIRGLSGMLRGELWLPRKVLQECFLRYREANPAGADKLELSLTRKELKTLQLMAQGKSNQDIATELFVSTHTVKTHIYNLFRKLGVSSRSQAVLWAVRHLGLQGAGHAVHH